MGSLQGSGTSPSPSRWSRSGRGTKAGGQWGLPSFRLAESGLLSEDPSGGKAEVQKEHRWLRSKLLSNLGESCSQGTILVPVAVTT